MGRRKVPPPHPPRDPSGMTEREMITDLWRGLYGSAADETKPGLLIRIDRLERKVGFAQWIASTALGGVICAGIGWLKVRVLG